MKTRIIVYGALIIGLVCLFLWWRQPYIVSSGMREKNLQRLIEQVDSNAIASGAQTNLEQTPWVRPSGVDDEGWKYLMLTRKMLLTENLPVQFHAHAIDQDGNGVPDAQLELRLTRVNELKVLREFPHMHMGSELTNEVITLVSDAAGWFHLAGRVGKLMVVNNLSVSGYVCGQAGYTYFDYDGKDPTAEFKNPAKGYTFHLWKKGMTEKLVKANWSVGVEAYGTNWYFVNLLTGPVKDARDADFCFWFETVKDVNGNPARNFRYEVLNGGLLEYSGFYPYQAPETGYTPALDWYYEPFGRHAKEDLSALMKKDFYVKLRNGKIFGVITWHWAAENNVGISCYFNPTGSRNLEPDPEKLITDPEEIHRLDEQTRVP